MRSATLLLLGVLSVLAGCQNPVNGGPQNLVPGTVIIRLGGDLGRAVVADFSALTTSYSVSLTSRNGYAPLSQSVASGPVAFTGVQAGQWDISVVALAGAQVLGAGSALNQTLSANGSLNLSLAISATRTATGHFSFGFSFPSSTGVDYVSAQLFDSAEAAVGSPVEPALTTSGSDLTGTVAAADLASGVYRLELTFKRGGASGTVAAILGEAVNVWDGVTSNQWLGPDGLLHAARAFSATEFSSADASLANLTAQGYAAINLNPGFSSGIVSYSSLTGYVSPRITATRARAGQKLEYRQDGGSWISLTSGGPSAALNVGTGTVIQVRVTAPDQVTTNVYQINWAPGTLSYNGNGSTGGNVPSAVTLESGTVTTVEGGYIPPTRPGYTLSGWNTAANGSGTAYAVGANLTMGYTPVTLYAQWTVNSYKLSFSGNGYTGSMADLTIPFGATVTLPPNTLTSSGKTFTGWSTTLGGAVVYADGASFTMTAPANTTIYAVFVPTVYTITLHANGGTGSMAQVTGTAYATPTLPLNTFTREGYTFVGWAKTPTAPVTTTNGYMVFLTTLNVDLYAVWIDSAFLVTATQVTGATASVSLTGLATAPSGGVIVPDVVTIIDTSAFQGLTGLTSVVVPATVKAVGSWAFNGCTSLSLVTMNPVTPPGFGSSVFDNCPAGFQIAVPAASLTAYAAASGWVTWASHLISL